MKTFIEQCIEDISVADKINDFIDDWHDCADSDKSISEYLGLTSQEYFDWIASKATVESILEDRKPKVIIPQVDKKELELLQTLFLVKLKKILSQFASSFLTDDTKLSVHTACSEAIQSIIETHGLKTIPEVKVIVTANHSTGQYDVKTTID